MDSLNPVYARWSALRAGGCPATQGDTLLYPSRFSWTKCSHSIVILRGLYTLFRLVGREKELHGEINGFSLSQSDVDVRIWGHYAVIDGEDVKYYRYPIRNMILRS